MAILHSGQTDIGCVRKTNQDSIFIDPSMHFYLVADGMGGHQGGDIASQMAVDVIPKALKKLTQLEKGEAWRECLTKATQEASKAIYEYAEKNPKLKGMGTTAVGLFFKGSHLYMPNVGDSRAYLVNHDNLFQLTRDHSMVQEKINLGIYTREQAKDDKAKNVLVRTLGYDPAVEVDVFSYKVQRGDLFLICSDGLHGKVSDNDILKLVKKNLPDINNASQENLDQLVKDLIGQAKENGGNDNISVIITLAR